MPNIGVNIISSVRRALPILSNGKQINLNSLRFSYKSPYILDALPQNIDKNTLSFLEGRKLKNACECLDNPDILKRWNLMYGKNAVQTGFNQKEMDALYRKAFPNIKIPTDANCDALAYLGQLPEKIGCQYDAHGLAKMTITEQLKQLNKLLTKGIDKSKPFHTAPLICNNGTYLGAAGGAYKDGSFILLSKKGGSLLSDGIETVIVNDAYYKIIDDLAKKFPNINFERADKCLKYFESKESVLNFLG